jgi:hypothetical protein
MTDRAWALARQHDINAVPPDPAALRNAVRDAANEQRRIRRAMADLCRITSWETPIRLIMLPLMSPPDVGSRRTGKSCVVIAG